MFDVAEEARKEMLLSGFKKPIHPKVTDLGLWKKGQVHESRCITYTIYKCPMSRRAGCRCMLRLVMAKDAGYLELQHSEARHHAASHAQDDSKKLKYDRIVAIRDAAVNAHQISAATLRRNMEMHESPTKTSMLASNTKVSTFLKEFHKEGIFFFGSITNQVKTKRESCARRLRRLRHLTSSEIQSFPSAVSHRN